MADDINAAAPDACGMAMGYADPDAVVNTFQPPRIALEDYAVFLD